MLKKKFFGQHFLQDKNIIQKIIQIICPKQLDNMIEIGPGDGALTIEILPFVSKLSVIEIDKDLIPILQKKCKFSSKLFIYQQNVLTTDFSKIDSNLRIIGNLPYNISTQIIFCFVKYIDLIEDMYFMLQKEVGERIIAKPGSKKYGRLSVMTQYYFETELLMLVNAESFSPPPKVQSVFVKIKPRKLLSYIQNKKLFEEVVKNLFNKRRKTIRNILKKNMSEAKLINIGINPNLRPENLSLNDFINISNNY